VTIYTLIYLHNAAIIDLQVTTSRPEPCAGGASYLIYESVLDSPAAPVLIERG
jgi:hypothetical protein